jgi:hypothetical protein
MAVQTAVVTQSELQQIHELQVELTEKQSQLDSMTNNVKALLFAKASIELGLFDARLSFKRMHTVPWKQVVIDKLGYDYMESVRLATPTVTAARSSLSNTRFRLYGKRWRKVKNWISVSLVPQVRASFGLTWGQCATTFPNPG